MQISLSYSPTLQRLSVAVLRARGLQLLTDAGEDVSPGFILNNSLKHDHGSESVLCVCVVCVFCVCRRRCVCPGELTDTHSGGEDEAQLCGDSRARPALQPQDDLQTPRAAPGRGLSELPAAAAGRHPLR